MGEKLNDLTFLSFNANSLFNKMDDLQHLVLTFKSLPLFICVCETWCNAYEPDTLYALEKYYFAAIVERESVAAWLCMYWNQQ